MRIFFRATLPALLACFFLLGGGCGKSETLYPVSGKVTLGTAPMTGGIVTYIPDESKGNKSKHSPTGKIGSDGTYTLTTEGKPGAPAGHYKVTVSGEMPGMGGGTTPGEAPGKATLGGQGPKVDPKFTNPATTPLTKEVTSGGKDYDITVK
jgi:hypothetical protein